MLPLRSAAQLLAAASNVGSLAAIAAAAGFTASPLPLDVDACTALGVRDIVRDVRIVPGAGTLRAMLIECPSRQPLRESVGTIAARLAARSPHLLWLVIAARRDSTELAIVAWSTDRATPRVSALVMDRAHVLASDALALASLAAASTAFAATSVSHYDEMSEGFLGNSFTHNGIHYHTVNNVGGVFPDGSAFVPADIGEDFIIETSSYFFDDYPTWGSRENTLTFGTAYVNGPNLSLGAFANAWMDVEVSNSVSFDMAFYENGPWGGIVFHLDCLRNGVVVGSDTVTIADGGGRDNIKIDSMSVSGVEFDQIHIHARFGADFSAPRLLIDNLTLTSGATCGTSDFDCDGDTGTDFDIQAFFACLGGNCPPAPCTSTADFDADGDTGTDFDIQAFFRVLGGGNC